MPRSNSEDDANGEPGGARTRDHMIKSHVLYQLSYRPIRCLRYRLTKPAGYSTL